MEVARVDRRESQRLGRGATPHPIAVDQRSELAPVDLMREIFVFGSAEQIRARVQEFVDGGITTAVLTPIAGPDQVPALIDALARS